MTPPVPVIEAGAGVIGADERDDHVATVGDIAGVKGIHESRRASELYL